MTIAKKGSRKIVVDGYEFVWKFRKRIHYNERQGADYSIPVQHIDGQILLISTGYNRSGYDLDYQFHITPKIIEKCIRLAISKGWQFDKKLPPLEIDCSSIIIDTARSNTEQFIKEVEKDNQNIAKIIAKYAIELITVGEYQIALENIVDNVCEYNIELDKKTISLAEQSFHIWKDYKYLLVLRDIKTKKET